MINIKGKFPILIIFCILVLTTSTGCLSMIYYPARVPDKGKMYLGIGAHLDNFNNDYIPAGSIFFRRGFGQGIDVGCEVRTLFFLPSELLLSVRKELRLNDPVCDAITIDVGYSPILSQEAYISAAFLKDEYSLRTILSRNSYSTVDLGGGSSQARLNDAFSVSFSREFKWKKFIFMPFIFYKYSSNMDVQSITSIFQFSNIIIEDRENSNCISGGVSLLFNL